MADSQPFDTPSNRASLDISRLRTVRLIPPQIADDLARNRAERALSHEIEATRLRQYADMAMTHFERTSQTAVSRLDEWIELQQIDARSPSEQARLDLLGVELERMEAGLKREWQGIADMLRKASHHDASAEILRTGHLSP
jgi:hypothetical protein